jgi:sulfotransferase family protein
MSGSDGALPNVIIIGAMKAGTSALHAYLDDHPDVSMSTPKELCFFYDPDPEQPHDLPARDPDLKDTKWSPGNWHRGVGWYRGHFSGNVAVRGESSPGYTSPSFPGVAARMASVVPEARLVYLVRDPVARAVSQYHHHVRDGTERRAILEAISDPTSHYILRSRYVERLAPFLERFPLERISIIVHEDFVAEPVETITGILRSVGVNPSRWALSRPPRTTTPDIPPEVTEPVRSAVADDVDALRDLLDRPLARWAV